jgi:CheY-like chemotaxis protein
MNKKVLIVEDDETLREIYALKLEMAGFEVETAGDGLEALEQIRVEAPDLIILDMMMPRLDGLQFLRRYTRLKPRIVAKILVASNKTFKPEIEEAKRLGASDYLVKSRITPDDLVERVHKHLTAAEN